jgi:hypothetical protein
MNASSSSSSHQTHKQQQHIVDNETNEDLLVRAGYFDTPAFIFKQADPSQDSKACSKELEAYSQCEIQFKKDAYAECVGFRDAYIECQRNFNIQKKKQLEQSKYASYSLYFSSGSDHHQVISIPSQYDIERAEKRLF